MPFFFECDQKVIDVFKLISKDKLVLVNINVPFINFPCPVICEDFENDIQEALLTVVDELRNFNRIVLIFPLEPLSNFKIINGFEKFCRDNELKHDVILGTSHVEPEKNDLFVIIDDDDLADFIKICRERKLAIGSDVGIISYNETVLKEVLAEGITVISTDDILKIMEVDLSKERPTIQTAKDLFLFSYLCSGVNFTDIANLQPNNTINRIEYIRQKTGQKINVLLIPDAIKILSKYIGLSKTTGYLLPILDKRIHKTAQQKKNRIQKVIRQSCKGLKRIALLCKIEINLTTYVPRHSFATIPKNSGVNIALISAALGHSDLSTTQIFLDSFENSQVNEAMKHLL